jgi:muconolactone delta-isomerase
MADLAEFLVRIDIDTGDLDSREVDRLRSAEAARAAELTADGRIIALWRVPGEWANYGLWRAADENELNAALESLPLRAHMKIRVQLLAPHPSDPRSGGDLGAGAVKSWQLDPLPELYVRGRSARRRPEPSRAIELPALEPLQVGVRPSAPDAAQPVQPQNREIAAASQFVVEVPVAANRISDDDVLSVIETIAQAEARLLTASGNVTPSKHGLTLDGPADRSISVTISGRVGLTSYASVGSSSGEHAYQLDVGAVSLEAAVIVLPKGDSAIQIRRRCRLTLMVPDGVPLTVVGQFAQMVQAGVADHWGKSHS